MSSEEEEYEVEIEEEEEELPAAAPKAPKKMMIQDNDPYNGTFIFVDEDHTLGNSLRFILSNHPNTEFCGYSLPHPSENKMNVRLQTVDKTKEEVMNEGLLTLQSICDIIEVKFKEAMHLD